MTLVSGSIPNLVNGVSQQPPAFRLASQCESQVNALSSVSSGLSKRPPALHQAKISPIGFDGGFIHTINRSVAERYNVIIHNGGLKVFRLNGAEVPVSFPQGTGYLASAAPAIDFRAVSVVDYTFILNRSRPTQQDPALLDTRPYEALVWVRQGAYSSEYAVTVDGVTGSFMTFDASQPSNAGSVRTDIIAANLRDRLVENLQGRGFTIQLYGSILHISRASEFSITTRDPLGDSAIKVIKGAVQSFADLPAKCVNGFRSQVRGSSETAFDDYYVEYKADPSNPNGGTWVECPKPGERYKMADASLPWVLIRQADGTFSFQTAPWVARTAGSLETVQYPSFVGGTIDDVFFHRNRLGFLAGENVILSRAGDFFNFFRRTALQVLDTDPIDVAVAVGGGAATLRHAVAFNEGLVLFSEQAQFQFGKSDLLTPKTASITLTTQFGCSLDAKPVGVGRNVYFALTRGDFSAIREYYLDIDTRANDAADITAHVPRYVPKNITKMAATSNEDILVAVSADAPRSVFVYRFYWQGNAKLQSSWSRWDFGAGDRILSVDFIESTLWLVIARADGTYLESMNLEPSRTDGGVDFVYHLDRRVFPTIAHYPEEGGYSEFQVPYKFTAGDTFECVATATGGAYRVGQAVPFELRAVLEDRVSLIRVKGFLAACLFGRQYEMRYRFSMLLIRQDAPSGGQQPVLDGRLQLRKMTLSHAVTGYYRAEVTATGRQTFRYVFAGRTLGAAGNHLGEPSTETGAFSFPIASKNDEVVIEVVNDTYHASTFQSADWEAFYTSRSRRI